MSYKEDVQKAFNFQIEKHHLSGCGVETPFFGLFRSDTMATVGHAVSRRYVPHTTDDVLALVESSSAAFGADCEVKCGFFNRHYVAIQPTREHRVSVYGTEDNIYPRVIVNAGYGGSAFKVSVGYYRDLCRNMIRGRLSPVPRRECNRSRLIWPLIWNPFMVSRESEQQRRFTRKERRQS